MSPPEAPRLLHEVVEGWSAVEPSRVALVHGEEVITYGGLAERVARAAAVVARLTSVGDRVAVIGPSSAAWIEAYYGVPRAGRVLLFLNNRLAPAELRSILDRAGATMLVGPEAELERLRPLAPEVPAVRAWVDLEQWATLTGRSEPADPVARRAASTAWLLYTSGTTGAPKGAMLTHRSVLAAVAATAAARPVADDDVYLFPFPPAHVAGYNVVHHHLRGRPVVLVDRFEPAAVATAIREHGVRSTSLAATMLVALLDHLDATGAALPTLRTVAYGAAPMPAAVLRRAAATLGEGVGFAQGYGMTELSGNAAFLDPAAHARGLGGDERLLRGAGYAAPGVELSIVDDAGGPVPTGEVGEVAVRAPQVTAGYWDDPAATAAALVDGWLRTGDVGRLDDDGLLTIVDRKKDVIVTGGENVSSLEVEDVLLTHPSVAAVAVVGVADERWGENVCAFVVPAAGSPIDAGALVAHTREHLAGFKVPRHVVVVDELPVNAAGKVVKAELRARLAADPSLAGPRNT